MGSLAYQVYSQVALFSCTFACGMRMADRDYIWSAVLLATAVALAVIHVTQAVMLQGMNQDLKKALEDENKELEEMLQRLREANEEAG